MVGCSTVSAALSDLIRRDGSFRSWSLSPSVFPRFCTTARKSSWSGATSSSRKQWNGAVPGSKCRSGIGACPRDTAVSTAKKDSPASGFEVAGAWQPASTVSGDYYDVLRLDDHRLGICIADVVGKGVSAALLMANVQAAVRAFASDSESPARVCAKVNSLLHENIATGKFVTFLYGILDGEAHTFQYCNAGHLYPILLSRGAVRMLEQGGAVLGVFADWTYEDSKIELTKETGCSCLPMASQRRRMRTGRV